MARRSTMKLTALGGAVVLLGAVWVASAAEPESAPRGSAPATASGDSPGLAKAREQARLMHQIYATTLDVMHLRFFRNDRSVLPARALEDVFDEMEAQTKVKARWISVNTKAMSVHHEPKTTLEKNAARAIAAGKSEYEAVEDGHYYRVGAIPLDASCINCHTGFFAKAPTSPRFAGLVISVPLPKKE